MPVSVCGAIPFRGGSPHNFAGYVDSVAAAERSCGGELFAMSRKCDSSGKQGKGGGFKYVRSGLPKKQGGIGLKIRGKTLRMFRPNLQKVRVQLPNGTVRRMTLAASVIKKGVINVKIDGKMRQVPLLKAPRGSQALWLKESQAAEEAGST